MKKAVFPSFFTLLILISPVSLAYYIGQDEGTNPTNLITNGSFQAHGSLESGGRGTFDSIEG